VDAPLHDISSTLTVDQCILTRPERILTNELRSNLTGTGQI
jgi:hypothetical protein